MAYNLLLPVSVVKNGSMAGSITSAVLEIKEQDNVGIQMVWIGAPVGSFDVQVSMDYFRDINGNVTNPGNWTSIPLLPTVAASGSPDNAYVDLNQLSAPYIRLVYTRVSGAGTLNVLMDGKGV